MKKSSESTGLPASTAEVAFAACTFWLLLPASSWAAQFVVDGPVGSGRFGSAVTMLPNGNFVVIDPEFDAPGPVENVGAVYLYRPNGVLISTIRGTTLNDKVGSGGVKVLANGNYVISSPEWSNSGIVDAGAVTFGSATTGVSGIVSPNNSLVGSSADDLIGLCCITPLVNGNYVVTSSRWDHGSAANAGAATFGSGIIGVSGAISPENSLVGGSAGDQVGSPGATALSNGNYVVASQYWRNGKAASAGAATFGSGVTGVQGLVSLGNSLFGTRANDRVGTSGVTALTTGGYVVGSSSWQFQLGFPVGAATFGSGGTGIIGPVSALNSLVGSTTSDFVGERVVALTNGNYLVVSPFWRNGALFRAGAVTLGSGISGVNGEVSSTNSLVGGSALDEVGAAGAIPLTNGNYVVASPFWNNGNFPRAGAATFGSGEDGVQGVVSAANSMVGSSVNDQIGSSGVTALANGNYVVASPLWNNDTAADAGAATFGLGTSGITGPASPANSLVGNSCCDQLPSLRVTALDDGNYAVSFPNWSNGAVVAVGAVAFGSGTVGTSGEVSSANSLIGSNPNDQVGLTGVTALSGGSFVVGSPRWSSSGATQRGAATFGSGLGGIVGEISPINSVIGSNMGDQVGTSVQSLGDGNYAVFSPHWSSGPTNLATGAITLGLLDGSVNGEINEANSVRGLVAGQGITQVFTYDAARKQLAVGQPASNRVVLLRPGIATATVIVGDDPDPSITGQAVTFVANVTASPLAPVDGQIVFRASSGESCTDITPTATSPTTAEFSCAFAFTAAGATTVEAEYTDSILHAYSGAEPEAHVTIDLLFGDGFES